MVAQHWQASKVGVRAIDDKTLEIRLAAPAPHFLGLLSHHSYMPIPKHVVESNPNWATSPKTYVGNGPFLLTEWRHHDRLVFKKNPRYWNAKTVKLDELVFPGWKGLQRLGGVGARA